MGVGARRTALAAAMPAAAVAAAATLGGGGGASSLRNTDGVDGAPSTTSSTTTTAARQPLRARILAAAGASFVSVIVVNPFDVVKVRTGAGGTTMFFLSMGIDVSFPFAVALPLTTSSVKKQKPTPAQKKQTRMQAASAFRSPAFAAAGAAGASAAATAAGATTASSSAASLSASAVLRSVLAREGWRGLWRGADFALLMSLPMVGVYMPLYDDALAALRALPGRIEETEGEGSSSSSRIARALASDAVAPALAGGAARAVAVVATSPLELARTRAQAPPGWGAAQAHAAAAASGNGASSSPSSSSSTFKAKIRRLPAALPQASSPGIPAAVRAAWTGSAATLARDVPFSALYWALLEPVRSGTLRWWGEFAGGESLSSTSQSSALSCPSSSSASQPPASAVVFANLVSGATAGGAAAALTTPFDVVKTKLQLEAGGGGGSGNGSGNGSINGGGGTASVLSTLRSLHRRGGARALFAGVGPRSARAAPACAIVVAAYEVLKMIGAGNGGEGGGGSGVGGGGGDWRDEEGLGLAAEEN